MVSISLCMIVKDEEEYLGQCLESVKNLVDEIIIVDTGSKDMTKSIALESGARVFDYKWDGNTAGARNFSLSKANGGWILILDADEFMQENDFDKLKEPINSGKYDAVKILQYNYVNDVNHGGFKPLDADDPNHGKFTGYFLTPIIRAFRNTKEIFFEGKMHEIVDGALARMNGRIAESTINLYHYGFVRNKNKSGRYSGLADIDEGDDGRKLYIKGVAYSKGGNFSNAIGCFLKSLEMLPNNIQLIYVMGAAYLEKGELEPAISILEKAKSINPKDAETFDNQDCYSDLYNNLGAAYMKKGLVKKAADAFKEGLKKGDNPKIYNNLSFLAASLKKYDEALFYASKALKLAPNDISLLSNFASILVMAGKKGHAVIVYKKLLEIDNKNKEIWEKKINALT